jgi:uncharacterized protein
MHGDIIGTWEHTQAELEIRRWLHSIGLWAPGAERFSASPEEGLFPAVLSEAQIEELLRSEVVGRIGCWAEGKVYVVPIVYVYDGQAIYAHTGEGLKLRMLRANPQVCFEVDHVESLTNWQSVIAWGWFEELCGAEAERAVDLLAERIKPLVGEREGQPSHSQADGVGERAIALEWRPVVFRIRLTERTGRAIWIGRMTVTPWRS